MTEVTRTPVKRAITFGHNGDVAYYASQVDEIIKVLGEALRQEPGEGFQWDDAMRVYREWMEDDA